MEPGKNSNCTIYAIRGASTCAQNNYESIKKCVNELVKQLLKRNNILPIDVLSISFTATRDLDACFPASIVRESPGWDDTALLDCQQMYVKTDLKKCIRLLAYVWLPYGTKPSHPYLENALNLRPDRSKS